MSRWMIGASLLVASYFLSGCFAGTIGGVTAYTELTAEERRWAGPEKETLRSVGQCMEEANAGATSPRFPSQMTAERQTIYQRCMAGKGYTRRAG